MWELIVAGLSICIALPAWAGESWTLFSQTHDGEVHFSRKLTKEECEFGHNRLLGLPASPEEKAKAAKEEAERQAAFAVRNKKRDDFCATAADGVYVDPNDKPTMKMQVEKKNIWGQSTWVDADDGPPKSLGCEKHKVAYFGGSGGYGTMTGYTILSRDSTTRAECLHVIEDTIAEVNK